MSALNKASFLNKIFFYSDNVFVLKKCLPARTGGDRGSSALLRLVVGPWVDSPGAFASKIDQRFNL